MKRVLIVEDDENLQNLFKRVLEKQGLEVDVTDNVVTATELATKSPYSLYLVDILLQGGLTGEKLVDSSLRPMIVVSALDLQLETVGFLRKPFKNETLVKEVFKRIQ